MLWLIHTPTHLEHGLHPRGVHAQGPVLQALVRPRDLQHLLLVHAHEHIDVALVHVLPNGLRVPAGCWVEGGEGECECGCVQVAGACRCTGAWVMVIYEFSADVRRSMLLP